MLAIYKIKSYAIIATINEIGHWVKQRKTVKIMNTINNDMIQEINENLKLMLAFAEKAGISYTEIPNYSLAKDEMVLHTEKTGVKEELDLLEENVIIQLHKEIDKLKVQKDTRYQFGYTISESNPDCEDYYTTSYQEITEFLVRDGTLTKTTASISQTIHEHSLFDSDEFIIDLNCITDFLSQARLESLPKNHSEIKMEIENYSIPEGYHITDGVGVIVDSNKVIQKTRLSQKEN